MKFLPGFLAVFGFLELVNGAAIDGRIVNGVVAAITDFPWQASLRRNLGRHFCGGTLISSDIVLTAAHCVDSFAANEVNVVTGSDSLAKGGQYHGVKNIIYHANYSAGAVSSWENDIALVKLSTEAPVSARQAPASVGVDYVTGNTSAALSGWGRVIHPGYSLPTALQSVNLTILSNEECQAYHSLTIHDTHICAFSTYGEGVCSGDSGGGLIVDGAVVGITSWARLCAVGVPDVYTRVSSFVDWIDEKSEELSN
ncbi:chymotrypsin-2 [Cephus cinctus]|uniref:chymotrypsin n=1 Tax=Cephus cinctus TaxID=211228 RepID=A0AAJ7FEQ6_CEPCN|nr:chymotrypsin-2 [Cephus cinctus]